ncbi:sugar phosphate isomerase/epimerase family protein [Herbiconiux sp. UC225_62]|uniref:sugar phosphate isomerase/epimerase family protein n=1 Tax=Herbiconiux sp. UC225_62 TaxID=3350168 RepID=UPI0036D219EA
MRVDEPTAVPLLGAFARIFSRPTVNDLAVAFEDHALTQVQLNLSALGLPTIPRGDELRRLDVAAIQRTFGLHGSTVWGVSATFNTAHPDPDVRKHDTADAARFIAALGDSGAVAATLCSGSRDPANMWGRHPDTASEAAWSDFRRSLDALLPSAEAAGVLLAIEPEPANTVSGTDRALRLIDELGPDADTIGFILDPANLIDGVAADDRRSTLERAFDALGDRAICVHAKDTVPWAQTLAGAGVVDYDLVGRLHAALPQPVPVVIQDASETEIDAVAALVRERVFAGAAA